MQVGGWGHLGVFGVVGGQIPNISEHRHILCQNKALSPVITKKWILGSSDPKLGGFEVIGGQNLKILEPRHIFKVVRGH